MPNQGGQEAKEWPELVDVKAISHLPRKSGHRSLSMPTVDEYRVQKSQRLFSAQLEAQGSPPKSPTTMTSPRTLLVALGTLVALFIAYKTFFSTRISSPWFNTMGWPSPGLAADALVCRVSKKGPEILLVKRRFQPFKGMWAFPGGFVNVGEDPRLSAVRELEEETGLTLRFDPRTSHGASENSEDGEDQDETDEDEEERKLARMAKLVAVNGSPRIDPRGHAISIAFALRLPLFVPAKILKGSKKARREFLDSVKAQDDAAEVEWIPVEDIQSGKAKMAFRHGETILGEWIDWWEREGKMSDEGESWFVEV